jgi:hypothetical protein
LKNKVAALIYNICIFFSPTSCLFIPLGPKRDEETGGWRKLHNEELHNLYSSPNITRIIKSRRMR